MPFESNSFRWGKINFFSVNRSLKLFWTELNIRSETEKEKIGAIRKQNNGIQLNNGDK